jgi:ribosomal protein L4
MRAEGLNVYDLLDADQLVLLAPSVRQIEGRLG